MHFRAIREKKNNTFRMHYEREVAQRVIDIVYERSTMKVTRVESVGVSIYFYSISALSDGDVDKWAKYNFPVTFRGVARNLIWGLRFN